MKTMTQIYTNEVDGEFILSFGKYNGYTLNEVLKENPQYLRWLFHATDFIERNNVSSSFIAEVNNG